MALQVRIGATRFDHGNKGLEAYERLRAVAFELGFGGYLRESALITLYENFGLEKAEWGMHSMFGLRNHSWNTLIGIIEGSIPAERKAPARVNERPVDNTNRSRADSPTSIGKLAQKLVTKYPTKDHIYDEPAAGKWMRDRGHRKEDYEQYFEVEQRQPFFLFTLKSKYR